MIGYKLLFGSIGLFILALVGWAIRAGWYPSRGRRITRTDEPFSFWSVMAVSAAMGAIFFAFAIAL